MTLGGTTRPGRILALGAAALCVLLSFAPGCFRSRGSDFGPPTAERTGGSGSASLKTPAGIPPAIPIPDDRPGPAATEKPGSEAPSAPPAAPSVEPPAAAPTEPPVAAPAEPPVTVPADPHAVSPPGVGGGDTGAPKAAPAPAQKARPGRPAAGSPAETALPRRQVPPPGLDPAAKPAALPAPARQEMPPPHWATRKETLAYRVDFLGITMGYARLEYMGRVSVDGKTAHHVTVKAWTSGVLSYLYPVNETIEYYLDTENMLPVRIAYTGRKDKRDYVALYDQEKGEIVYRYLDTGKIRKKVNVVPGIYDPVSVVYYFRWRDMGKEDGARNVYGGRKVYQIAARSAGTERLGTSAGPVDTLVIEPVIRRNGKLEDKGDLRMWVTDDERRIPVRIYGKFRKIREWTLIGVLLPERPGG